MFSFFKRIPKSFNTGYLDVGDGHQIYYQQFGNPKGIPVLSFHGGPGGSSKAKHVTHYNLKKYRVVVFDQRGCGCSLFKDAFFKNTTKATIKDAKLLLEHLGIKGKIIVNGASFGASLALLFAETYPELIKHIIVSSVFLMRPEDAEWVTHMSRIFYPDFIDPMREMAHSKDIVSYFHKLIFSKKGSDIKKAQKYYGTYEMQLGKLSPTWANDPDLTEEAIRSTRIYLHYEKNKFFVGSDEILGHIKRIQKIPTLIVHNRLDFCCPVVGAYELHQKLPKSKLVIVPSKGHGSALLFKILDQEIAAL